MGSVVVRLRRHGDDRQPSVRLDAVCAAHGEGACATALAAFRCAVGFWAVHRRRYLDHAVLGVVHRQDRPRLLMVLSGLLCAVGWGSLGHVGSLTSFYAFYCLAGVG